MATVISRDVFARVETVRKVVSSPAPGGCSWCGGTSRKGKLFSYGLEPDDRPGRVVWAHGQFCSKSCCHSYNE
jgi:hypothetical protein